MMHLENSMEVPQKLKIEPLCDPAIPLLNIFPKDCKQDLKEMLPRPYSLKYYSH